MKILKHIQCVLLIPVLLVSACSITPSRPKSINAFDNSKFSSTSKSIVFEGFVPKNTKLEFYAYYSSSRCTDSLLVFPAGDFSNPKFEKMDNRGYAQKTYPPLNEEQTINTKLPLFINDRCEWKLNSVKSYYTYYSSSFDDKVKTPIEYSIRFNLKSNKLSKEQYSFTPELYIIDVTSDRLGAVEKKKQALYKKTESIGLNYTHQSGKEIKLIG